LVPKSLDPVARGRAMPLPDPRPSKKIATLFPQTEPLKNSAGATEPVKSPAPAAAPAPPAQAAVATAIPLPEARPNLEPSRDRRRPHYYRHFRRYRGRR
jgi:membrane-bound lytic murein transglycosylase A